jgi:uncharacterized protein YrzB (UPF0473 family)
MCDGKEASMDYEGVDELEEIMTLTLEFEDGTEGEYGIILAFEVEGKDYMALVELEGDELVDDEIMFKRYEGDIEGELELFDIEDDDELQLVCDIYNDYVDGLSEDDEEGE